ncbi:hypothetical protein JHK87_000940 [Glycine soja]|nr:hypothetical protein JHK87_000940 [Glycine soja]
MAINNLKGDIPQEICRLKSLTFVTLDINKLSGTIPSCPIPPSITNASILSILHIDDNYFTGQVSSMGKLQYLYHLEFSNNNLGDNSTNDLEFLKSLTSCSKLHR